MSGPNITPRQAIRNEALQMELYLFRRKTSVRPDSSLDDELDRSTNVLVVCFRPKEREGLLFANHNAVRKKKNAAVDTLAPPFKSDEPPGGHPVICAPV